MGSQDTVCSLYNVCWHLGKLYCRIAVYRIGILGIHIHNKLRKSLKNVLSIVLNK